MRGLPAQAAQFVFEGRAFKAAEDEAKRVAEAGGFFLTREDAAYPERLLEIYDPPAVLWIRGDATLLAGRELRWWERGSLRRMERGWRRCCRAIWRTGGW